MEYFILLKLLIFLTPNFVLGQDCVVTIKDGTIQGKTQTISNPPKQICSYTAIPYASPPIGNLRFKAPTAPSPFSFLNATGIPNSCPQPDSPLGGGVVSEDCLYLNIYTPMSFDNLPVMIWFYGGAFSAGNSYFYTPDKLLGHADIILVTVHYRLGLLGFLNTEDHNSPGNWGLKDQSFAIHWVKENIVSFKGDPDKLTIFGESAGGASVMYQLISPLNKGLINGVISQSGTALVPWAIDDSPLASAKSIASVLQCPTNETDEMVACLRNLSWERIVQAQTEVNDLRYENYELHSAGIVPSVEPNLSGAFMAKHPLELLKDGEFDDVPVMIGANKHDGSFDLAFIYEATIKPERRDEDPDYMKYQFIPDLLKLFRIKDDEGNRAVANSIEMAYLEGVNRSSWEESVAGLVDFLSVLEHKSSIMQSADLLSKRGNKVFVYSMEYESNLTMWDLFFPELDKRPPVKPGVSHMDELLYLFHFGRDELTGDDKRFEGIMLDLWINFAKTGNPTRGEWKEYDRENEFYYELGLTPVTRENYRGSWRTSGFGLDHSKKKKEEL